MNQRKGTSPARNARKDDRAAVPIRVYRRKDDGMKKSHPCQFLARCGEEEPEKNQRRQHGRERGFIDELQGPGIIEIPDGSRDS